MPDTAYRKKNALIDGSFPDKFGLSGNSGAKRFVKTVIRLIYVISGLNRRDFLN